MLKSSRRLHSWLTPVYVVAGFWTMRVVHAALSRQLRSTFDENVHIEIEIVLSTLLPVAVTWTAVRAFAPTSKAAQRLPVTQAMAALLLGASLVLPIAWLTDHLMRTLAHVGGLEHASRYLLRPARRGTHSMTRIVVLAVIVSAITEELVFRELVLARVRRVAGRICAVTSSSLAFALCHSSTITAVQALLLGLLLAVARSSGAHIACCILVHAVFNFLVSLLAGMVPVGAHTYAPTYAADLPLAWVGLSTLVAATVLCASRTLLFSRALHAPESLAAT